MKRLEDLPQIADEAMAGLEAGPELKARILALENLPRIAEETMAGLEAGPELKARILALENLPRVAEETLGGLEAGPELKYRVVNGQQTKRKPSGWRYAIPAMACAWVATLVLIFTLVLPNLRTERLTASYTAGGPGVANETGSLDRSRSQLRVTQNNASSRQGIWDGNSMIRIDERYYRRLKGLSMDRSSLGGVLAVTEEYTQELTLSSAGCTSNTVPAGTPVYAVNGMGGSLVACETGGGLQVYQRVSFNGVGLIGGENFNSVMPYRGHVVAMSLSGVGLVEGSAAADLFETLAACARYENPGSVTQRQVLIIELDNGAAVQMDVNGDRLSACGAWSCPEFIEAFENAAR